MISFCWVCVGVLEARLVLVLVHQLSISLSQLLDDLINPTLLAWLICCLPDKPNCVGLAEMCTLVVLLSLVRCKPVSSLFLGNHARLGGGSVAERLRSTRAYGWVERCSDAAGCGTSSL